MLISSQLEQRINGIIRAISSSYQGYLIGRSLGQSVLGAAQTAVHIQSASSLTIMEQSYLAGKLATTIGVKNLAKMSEPELLTAVKQSGMRLTGRDQVLIKQLKDNTGRWVTGRSEAWANRWRQDLAAANKGWTAALTSGVSEDAATVGVVRNKALQNLLGRVKDQASGFQDDMSRLVQSEMNNYFQAGQVSDTNPRTYVYKIPRMSACPICMELHLNSDGSPIKYLLEDVQGNSNIGLPQYAWQFTIGPTHPWCYCVLYFEGDESDRPDEARATAREEMLTKSIPNTCGIEDDPNLLYEEQLQKAVKHHVHGGKEVQQSEAMNRLVDALSQLRK